ncbi:MAG: FHA domain-containing protein [Prevotella sp.]|nr:FHA domain-containing protein [Prevotella sp.]
MIICPTCKEEIDDGARFCDQCGQALVYCSSCGRVGKGRRCIYCGNLMISAEELEQKRDSLQQTSLGVSFTARSVTAQSVSSGTPVITSGSQYHIPVMTLYNDHLDIRIVGQNGAMIGRRQGPYTQYFQNNMYVSGVHAQLVYNNETGWSIIDKHSSNGTKLNDHALMPDVPMSLKNGDIVTLANVSMQVSIG